MTTPNKALEYQDNAYIHEVSQSQPNKKGIVNDGRTGRMQKGSK